LKNWIARKRIENIAKCHRRAIPVWAGWLGDKVVGVIVKRTDDPSYAHNCHGILVLSSRMDWETAVGHICEYMGCKKEEAQIQLSQLRGHIELDIMLLKMICEAIHARVKENDSKERRAES
jgi:hypothetical protein